jgi:POT family proton-dependent oligopeptide transporter
MSNASSIAGGQDQRRTFLGHPIGLYILFFTEMWERFSYYGMRALLVLYMVNYFKWTQTDASTIYKWYTSLVYLTPLLGGFLADRYLGNKWAIVIGAILMAVGHFCMAFEQLEIFYAALAFLIIGNGFFKPNMSTQVGRLYPANDPRVDGAYTIFYMGINLGAFLSPIVCGALANGTRWGYHAGFTAAGIGMVCSLVIYLLGLPLIRELPPGTKYEGPEVKPKGKSKDYSSYMSEKDAETAPSAIPAISSIAPLLMTVAGVVMIVAAIVLWRLGLTAMNNAIALGLGGGAAAFMSAWVLSQVKLAVRDRVLAIMVLAVFVVFFWAAFEQAGNAMNVFADKITNRYVTQAAPTPSIYPPASHDEQHGSVLEEIGRAFAEVFSFNPMSTESFQAVNPLAIFLLAPLFAFLWTYLPRRGIHLSIPAKMATGIFLQGLAFALMIWAIQYENQPTQAALAALPPGVVSEADGRVVFRDAPALSDDKGAAGFEQKPDEYAVVHGGRLSFASGRLLSRGVLSDTDRDRILRATVSPDYFAAVRKLALDSASLKDKTNAQVAVTLTSEPAGMDMRFAGFQPKHVRYEPESRTLVATKTLADREFKMLLLAGADANARNALNDIYVHSAAFKLSVWWLIVFYLLCTVGELCLSPVGLSMVSKLAPARFATMLMGMWLLTSFFGNFAAGLAGESWGTVDPKMYFLVITASLGIVSLICYASIRNVKSLMHGVN